MKTTFKKTSLALAVAGLLGSPAAFACISSCTNDDQNNDDGTNGIEYSNSLDVSMSKHVSGTVDTNVHSYALIFPESAASAVIDDKQIVTGNLSINLQQKNEANVGGSISDNEGSVQSNVAAGFNNNQDNAGAIAATLSGSKGHADAETFVFQDVNATLSVNIGQSNAANVVESMNNNQGSMQSNVAAGAFNNQKNNLAVAVASDGVLATANVGSLQQVSGNVDISLAAANTANVVSSLNGNAGSAQSNVAAGVGNNQANSLSIAAGL